MKYLILFYFNNYIKIINICNIFIHLKKIEIYIPYFEEYIYKNF
jgi:hypothetical protein